MKGFMQLVAFLGIFGFALFLGLDSGHATLQHLAGTSTTASATPPLMATPPAATPTPTPTMPPLATPAPSPSPDVQPLALNDIRYQPSKLEQVADATSTVIQKTATKGVEWTVTLFDALLN
jgi:hypothetical protein